MLPGDLLAHQGNLSGRGPARHRGWLAGTDTVAWVSPPTPLRFTVSRPLATGAAAVAASGSLRVLPGRVPGGAARWQRTNHRAEPVTLLGGPAAVIGLASGVMVGTVIAGDAPASATPGLVAVVGAGLAGGLDDLFGVTDTKGIGGHLRALARGEVTTGAVKIVAIGAAGLLAATLGSRGRSHPLVVAADGALIAGSANLINLFDLRPGRALKVSLLVATALAAVPAQRQPGPESGAVIGTALGLLGDDLAERAMLGDTGANALGAALAVDAVRRWSPRARHLALAGVIATTLASERVSFTKLIADTPVLNALDQLGRRNAPSLGGTS